MPKKKEIGNILQARAEMEEIVARSEEMASTVANGMVELSASVRALQEFFTRIEGMMGITPQKPNLRTKNGVTFSTGVNGSKETHKAPASMMARVLAIMRELDRPMTVAQVRDEYVKRSWPIPNNKRTALYNNVGGTMAYLAKKKRVIQPTKEGYIVNPYQEVSPETKQLAHALNRT